GEPLLLAVTEGFGDVLRIAYQSRPKLFEREIVLPELLQRETVEIAERLGADGTTVLPLDAALARSALQDAYDRGLRAIAIALMHSYRNPQHESQVEAIAREIGFSQISVSHQVSPLIRYVARGDTTVVDAYLSPVLRRYVEQIATAMNGVRVQFMQSNGGLADSRAFQGKDSILSGPAGGIVGMARVSQAAGFERVIGFDSGGTSTDVSHFAGEFEHAFETLVAGVRLRAPMLSIHTVAAGGGSILHFDGSRMRVGPDSAGANPGPACYRRNGPLTVTDANVMLGKIQPEYFPQVFGPGGDQQIDLAVVRQGFVALAERISRETGTTMSAEQVAQGFVDIANANMANAIKKISVQRGYDITAYTLTTFGGAGGQHACQVADALAMPRVLAHPLAGVLSAYGMGLAEQVVMREQSIELPLEASGLERAQEVLEKLATLAIEQLVGQGESRESLTVAATLMLRYQGTDTALPVRWESVAQAPNNIARLRTDFEKGYRQRFAFLLEGRSLVIDSAVIEASGQSSA
ncbi:MAG: hydantoinase/oxoprolinase family protein, partial [Quisquiliibacterium sp.]